MKKTLLSVFLVIALVFTQFSVFAFDDMNEDRLSWAKTAVEEMADAGIIKGYEDGTFRPDISVTKQEALVLIARVLGFTEKSSEEYINIASDVYEDTLAEMLTPYKAEISYLLYRGVLTTDDLLVYASNVEATNPLKRYEAAILLTKIFESDLSAVEAAEIKIAFDDLADIPATAKPYVNYVCDKGIMNGMGDNLFMPNEKLTRAMIATLLYRIIPVLDFEYVEGDMLRYNADTSSIRLSSTDDEIVTHSVKANVSAILDGRTAKIADFTAGTKVRLTFSGADIIFVEGISSSFETTVSGIYNGYEVFEDATAILIKEPKTSKSTSYPISASITVTKNDKASSISDLVKTDYISASIKAGKVIHIQAEDKTVTVNGVVDSISFEPEYALNVKVGNEIIAYTVAENVTVRRNSKAVELSDIAAGDKVKLTLVYGLISEVSATSTKVNETGSISEILISNTPSLTVTIDGEAQNYYIARSANINAANGTSIYDLRLGDTIDMTIEGKTITDIKIVTSSASSTNFTGVVENVEASYGYIKLVDSTSLIFTKGVKVQDNAGASMTIKQIKAGDSITVFGTATSGAVEATLIIVNK